MNGGIYIMIDYHVKRAFVNVPTRILYFIGCGIRYDWWKNLSLYVKSIPPKAGYAGEVDYD